MIIVMLICVVVSERLIELSDFLVGWICSMTFYVGKNGFDF